MTIDERAIGPVLLLDIKGRLVLDGGDTELKEKVSALIAQGSRQIVLNVSDVTYVDSAGLGALVSSFLAARSQGCALRLLNPSPRLHELLAMSRLLTIVHVCESEEQALGSFGAGA